jgi:hypothetical protein
MLQECMSDGKPSAFNMAISARTHIVQHKQTQQLVSLELCAQALCIGLALHSSETAVTHV